MAGAATLIELEKCLVACLNTRKIERVQMSDQREVQVVGHKGDTPGANAAPHVRRDWLSHALDGVLAQRSDVMKNP